MHVVDSQQEGGAAAGEKGYSIFVALVLKWKIGKLTAKDALIYARNVQGWKRDTLKANIKSRLQRVAEDQAGHMPTT